MAQPLLLTAEETDAGFYPLPEADDAEYLLGMMYYNGLEVKEDRSEALRYLRLAGDHGQTTAGGIPIVALDMYEHAYHIDFGANARAYIDTFQRNIDWASTQVRYEDASKVEARLFLHVCS